MTKIKLCGLSRVCDVEAANELRPEYIGFVFAAKSRRYVTPEKAAALKEQLISDVEAVGVFVNESVKVVSGLLNRGIIDLAQLHGNEDGDYMKRLRELTDKPVLQAFRIDTEQDMYNAQNSPADFVLLDSGNGGTGTVFDWELIKSMKRPYFLAGGLCIDNVASAIEILHPYAVDVSTGIEINGYKDKKKMAAFVSTVRNGSRAAGKYGRGEKI